MRRLLLPLFLFTASALLAGCGTWGACGGSCGATYVATAPATCCNTCNTCGSYGYNNGWY